MNAPSLPTGYDVTKPVHAGRSDCMLTVGFDRQRAHIPRFLVQLHYQTATDPVQWTWIARMDHNETSTMGHDVYQEGLHVDIARRSKDTMHLHLSHLLLPQSRGTLIRECGNYLKREAGYFIDVYEGRCSPGRPPKWSSDGGTVRRMFNSEDLVVNCMSQESAADDALTDEELTELLADATDTTPEELKRQGKGFEIAPPNEATVVNNADDEEAESSE